jgi:hypothetical protein
MFYFSPKVHHNGWLSAQKLKRFKRRNEMYIHIQIWSMAIVKKLKRNNWKVENSVLVKKRWGAALLDIEVKKSFLVICISKGFEERTK